MKTNDVSDSAAPAPRQKQRPKDRMQRMRDAAERGDVASLIEDLEADSCMANNAYDFALLKKALEKLRKDNHRKLVSEALSRVLAFETYMMARCQCMIVRTLKGEDALKPNGDLNLSPLMANEWLPRLTRIHRGVLETSRALAATTHVMAMGRESGSKEASALHDPLIGVSPVEEEN